MPLDEIEPFDIDWTEAANLRNLGPMIDGRILQKRIFKAAWICRGVLA